MACTKTSTANGTQKTTQALANFVMSAGMKLDDVKTIRFFSARTTKSDHSA